MVTDPAIGVCILSGHRMAGGRRRGIDIILRGRETGVGAARVAMIVRGVTSMGAGGR